MKISILVSASSWGGTEVQTLGLARTLGQRGHQVALLAIGEQTYEVYQKAASSDSRSFRIHHLPVASSPGKISFTTWLRLLWPFKGDACIVGKNWLHFANFSLDVAVKVLFPRSIAIEHLEAPPLPPRIRRRHFRRIVPGVGLWWYQMQWRGFVRSLLPHRVVCVSDAVKRRLKQDYRFPDRKLVTIHNGVDPEHFRPSPTTRRAIRQRWGVPESALVYGAVGRLASVKGYDIVVDLFARLAMNNSTPRCYLVLVGEGPDRPTLEQAVASWGLCGQVLFPGFSDRPWEAYCGMDIFVMPSRNEGLPLTLLEAMACGCCPVAMGVSGIPEVIRDTSLGWCVPPDDAEAFLRAMERAAMATHEDLEAMARRAREHVLRDFNASSQFARIANLVEACSARPPSLRLRNARPEVVTHADSFLSNCSHLESSCLEKIGP